MLTTFINEWPPSREAAYRPAADISLLFIRFPYYLTIHVHQELVLEPMSENSFFEFEMEDAP